MDFCQNNNNNDLLNIITEFETTIKNTDDKTFFLEKELNKYKSIIPNNSTNNNCDF